MYLSEETTLYCMLMPVSNVGVGLQSTKVLVGLLSTVGGNWYYAV